MRFENLLTMLGGVLSMVTLIYLTKHPHAKGKPLSREEKLMMIPLFLSFCLLAIAGFVMFSRR